MVLFPQRVPSDLRVGVEKNYGGDLPVVVLVKKIRREKNRLLPFVKNYDTIGSLDNTGDYHASSARTIRSQA